MTINCSNHQAGKGSKSRPVKGDVYRSRFEEIFGRGKKKKQSEEHETEVKEKQDRELCPHCATMNLVQETPWVSKCLRCGYEKK